MVVDESLSTSIQSSDWRKFNHNMYVIFCEPTKKDFRYNPEIRQFRQIKAEDCNWTIRYLLCQDVIFNQTTDQINFVRQSRNEQILCKQISDLWFQAPDHDQIKGQRHDPYDHEKV